MRAQQTSAGGVDMGRSCLRRLHTCWILEALWTTAESAWSQYAQLHFRYKLIEAGSLAWRWPLCVSEGILINTIYYWWLWRCKGGCVCVFVLDACVLNSCAAPYVFVTDYYSCPKLPLVLVHA